MEVHPALAPNGPFSMLLVCWKNRAEVGPAALTAGLQPPWQYQTASYPKSLQEALKMSSAGFVRNRSQPNFVPILSFKIYWLN